MISALILIFMTYAHAKTCEYSYTVWNALRRSSEGPFHVKKDYSKILPHEKGPANCTPCEIDQRSILLKNGLRLKACHQLAPRMERTLNAILDSGMALHSVLGYRPSISKGKMDQSGRRTEFSNHAFGTALDLNEEHNGLYDNCLTWGPHCKLVKGGTWRPEHPLSIRPDGPMVQIFKQEGFHWGGEILGKQKDFMHFSLDGL